MAAARPPRRPRASRSPSRRGPAATAVAAAAASAASLGASAARAGGGEGARRGWRGARRAAGLSFPVARDCVCAFLEAPPRAVTSEEGGRGRGEALGVLGDPAPQPLRPSASPPGAAAASRVSGAGMGPRGRSARPRLVRAPAGGARVPRAPGAGRAGRAAGAALAPPREAREAAAPLAL